jgi:hypothetical protein
MAQQRDCRFEALVYTDDPGLAAGCAKSFAELPLDWVMFYQSSLALDYLSRERFDYVILDLDSADKGSILINTLRSGAKLHGVILAVTSGAVDPAILDLCYASSVFYPVRPAELQERLYSTMPLADRLAVERPQVTAIEHAAEQEESESVAEPSVIAIFMALFFHFGKAFVRLLASLVGMKHSLGILAQERVASIMASAGSVWFVQEITRDFRGVEFIAPPSAGPSSLMALGLLLWLCAKHRRVAEAQGERVLVAQRF